MDSSEPKIIEKSEKWLAIGVAGAIDVAQIMLDMFGVGAAVNRFIDIAVGGLILLYGQRRKLWTPKKLLILTATFAAEEIPIVDAFPFWCLDVANLLSGTITRKQAEEMKRAEFLSVNGRTPSNINQVRLPRNDRGTESAGPPNQNGYRRPNGGLTN